MSLPRYGHPPQPKQGYPPYQPKFPRVHQRPYDSSPQYSHESTQTPPQYHPTMPPPPTRQPPPVISSQHKKEYRRRPLSQPDPEIYRHLLDPSYKRKRENQSEYQKKQKLDDLLENRDDDDSRAGKMRNDSSYAYLNTPLPPTQQQEQEDDPFAHLVCFEEEGKPGVPDMTDPLWQPPLEDVSDWQPLGPPRRE